ncbi:hypothetical protein IAU60_005696 [Kwoniella sp. DSM 27419]
MAQLITPPYTPLSSSSTSSSFPVQDKQSFPSAPHAQLNSQTALLTPPDTPEAERWVKAERPLSLASDLGDLQLNQAGSVRKLSDNELSYYLPSRGDGVNDMYLHHGLRAPRLAMTPARLLHLWAYQLLRHPLLASHVLFRDYQDVSFVSARPTSLPQALATASDRFSYVEASEDRDLIDAYLNGPRTLSNDRLGYMFVKAVDGPSGSSDDKASFEVMLCATHYLGDGMALHTFMNEFYTLLGSDKTTDDFADMIQERLGIKHVAIPSSLEERLPAVGDGSELARAVGADEYKRSEARLIGGQAFPSNPVKQPRQTLVPTLSYDAAKTKAILGKCKGQGVTIAHAVFALCNVAWARKAHDREAPCLIYSALNLRPNMLPLATPGSDDSFFHLAVGYFNIVLPTLLPSTLTTPELFWHRAKATKAQTIKAVKSPFVVARSRETSIVRKSRAVKWAKIDDQAEAAAAARDSTNAGLGLGLGLDLPKRDSPAVKKSQTPIVLQLPTPETTPTIPAPADKKPAAVSQRALMGLSMLGNLDGMYKHAAYPALELSSLTTGSRQRSGGLLLFAYTFAGKLWLSLGYDKNGFAPGVIEDFWAEVQTLVDEVLL